MVSFVGTVFLCVGVTSAQSLLGLPLDIAGLLSSLKPASANDPRFANFKPAGSGDGMPVLLNTPLIRTNKLDYSAITLPSSQQYDTCIP